MGRRAGRCPGKITSRGINSGVGGVLAKAALLPAVSLSVPLQVDAHAADNWDDAHPARRSLAH